MEFGKIADWHQTDDRSLILVDETNHRILVQQPDGNITSYGRKGTRPGEFHYPRGILVLESLAYVVDSWNHRVQVFKLPLFQFQFEFGGFGTGPGQFFCPCSITFSEPWLIVADTNNARLSFHMQDGRFLFSSGVSGNRFPRKVRSADGPIEVQYESGEWNRLEFI
jgi:hypothetical protein